MPPTATILFLVLSLSFDHLIESFGWHGVCRTSACVSCIASIIFPIQFRYHRTVCFLKPTSSESDRLQNEAAELLAQARALRDQIPERQSSQRVSPPPPPKIVSPWSLDITTEIDSGSDYRLYVDIGREPGTWMEPRWGASGKRMEFTLDVRFYTDKFVSDPTLLNAMPTDGTVARQATVYSVAAAPYARLRQGFDRMECRPGAYRIDRSSSHGPATIRFLIPVQGSAKYGDIAIPSGNLYFSLPVFANRISQLSRKEGPVTVQRMGWHTGWRRRESRIVGVFRAVPLVEAKQKDGF